jgi:hypothetical protein
LFAASIYAYAFFLAKATFLAAAYSAIFTLMEAFADIYFFFLASSVFFALIYVLTSATFLLRSEVDGSSLSPSSSPDSPDISFSASSEISASTAFYFAFFFFTKFAVFSATFFLTAFFFTALAAIFASSCSSASFKASDASSVGDSPSSDCSASTAAFFAAFDDDESISRGVSKSDAVSLIIFETPPNSEESPAPRVSLRFAIYRSSSSL